jgi:hypothetical protein
MAENPAENLETASERLARSRAELRQIFEPPPETDAGRPDARSASGFPRSAIMKAITKHGGATGIALLAVALVAARPKLAVKLLRYLPVSAISKSLVSRFIESRQARQQ